MTDYKVNFKDLKAKVGIDDVAYALGYRLDRKAGVGRYMELVLGDGKEKRDALVICHYIGTVMPLRWHNFATSMAQPCQYGGTK